MPIRRTATALAIAIATFVAAPVAADCDRPGPIPDEVRAAHVAFVGTVVATSGPSAAFAVLEVWAGDVGARVDVRGLGDDPAALTEDDRQWEDGTTYLVIPIVDGGVLRDSICTATTEWHEALAELRPADATVIDASSEGFEVPTAVLLIGMAVIVVGGVSVVAFSRGRRTSSPPTR